MTETLGKWFPLNLDNSLHYCREKAATSKVKKEERKPLTIEDLDLRLRMVESIVIKGEKK